jgi:hypothetical protein
VRWRYIPLSFLRCSCQLNFRSFWRLELKYKFSDVLRYSWRCCLTLVTTVLGSAPTTTKKATWSCFVVFCRWHTTTYDIFFTEIGRVLSCFALVLCFGRVLFCFGHSFELLSTDFMVFGQLILIFSIQFSKDQRLTEIILEIIDISR